MRLQRSNSARVSEHLVDSCHTDLNRCYVLYLSSCGINITCLVMVVLLWFLEYLFAKVIDMSIYA